MLKVQYFGHLMRRAHWKRPWCWERLKARERGSREWDSITNSGNMSLSKLGKTVEDRGAWCAAIRAITNSLLGDSTACSVVDRTTTTASNWACFVVSRKYLPNRSFNLYYKIFSNLMIRICVLFSIAFAPSLWVSSGPDSPSRIQRLIKSLTSRSHWSNRLWKHK